MSSEANHSFVVIGRDREMSDAADPKTWTQDVVICDPWAKRCYFVPQIQDEMNRMMSVTGGVIDTDVLFSHPPNTVF